MEFSGEGKKLVDYYALMAATGYDRSDGTRVESAFNDFELRPFRAEIRKYFAQFGIRSVLDYGSGGSDWNAMGFDEASGQSAVQYFGLSEARRYEPARGIDERAEVDCVVSFDVLEHIFIADVPSVLRDMFRHARDLLTLNVACYPAAAKLPNGENAHVTVRPPAWWKGMVDSIASEYPATSVLLLCSPQWRTIQGFEVFSGQQWLADEHFVIEN